MITRLLRDNWKIFIIFLLVAIPSLFSVDYNRAPEKSNGLQVFGTRNVCFGQNLRDGLESGIANELFMTFAKTGSEELVKSSVARIIPEQEEHSKAEVNKNLFFYLGLNNENKKSVLLPNINCIYVVMYDLENKSTFLSKTQDLQNIFDNCHGEKCSDKISGVVSVVSFSFDYENTNKVFSFGTMCTEGFNKPILLKQSSVQVIGKTLDDNIIFHARGALTYGKKRVCGSEFGRMWFKTPEYKSLKGLDLQKLLPINVSAKFD